MLDTSNFVFGSAIRSLCLVMSECSLSGRGQGHVSNFYIVYFENFATTSRRYTTRPSSVCLWHLQDKKATRSRHGWVHTFITHCPTVTLQLQNFYLFRNCRTSSFCTVAWQLANFNWHDASRGPSAIAELLVQSMGAIFNEDIHCESQSNSRYSKYWKKVLDEITSLMQNNFVNALTTTNF